MKKTVAENQPVESADAQPQTVRPLGEIYADWKKGALASDEELGVLCAYAAFAGTTARDLEAGLAVEWFYANLQHSFSNALFARNRHDLVKRIGEVQFRVV